MTLIDNELDAILARRAVEPHSTDLAARIVRAARNAQPTQRLSAFAHLRAAFEYLMPHPAAAFASVLVLGLALGMSDMGPDMFGTTTSLAIDMDTGAIL